MCRSRPGAFLSESFRASAGNLFLNGREAASAATRWGRSCRVLALVIVASCLTESGCGSKGPEILIPDTLTVPTRLLSEIQQAENREQFGRCPIEVANRGERVQQVSLVRTGCACYGVSLDGRRLVNGESFSVAPGESQLLLMEFAPAQSHSEKFYTADLAYQQADGKTHTQSVKCQMSVRADVRLTPSVITVECTPDSPPASVQSVQVEHIYRSENGKSPPPEFQQLPEFVTVQSIREIVSPEEIEPQLWKQTWQALIEVRLPEERADSSAPLNFQVSFPASQELPVALGQGSLVIHSRKSVVFPNRVNFGKVAIGRTRARRILMTSNLDNLFCLRCDQATLPPYVTVRVNEHPDQRHLVEVVIHPRRPGPFSDVIKLRTDMYDVTEIAIRIEGVAYDKTQDGNSPDRDVAADEMSKGELAGTTAARADSSGRSLPD